MAPDCDVIVVGAGLSGLAAARAVAAAGAEPVVLEARDRVGGRVFDEPLGDGAVIERGAAFVGGTQDRMIALARETGVELFDTHHDGDNVVEVLGKVSRYSGTIPRLGPLALADFAQAQFRLERVAGRIDPAAPWEARGARRLDAQTFATWIRRNVLTRSSRRLLSGTCHTIWGADPEELSALYALAYVAGAGSLDMLFDVVGGAQHHRFAGGPQLVANRMAEELGERLRLESPVERIEHGPDGVRAGDTTARAAIVALPPPLAARIAYEPRLPGARDQLAQRMPMGAIAKCFAIYDEPFWRADGLSGEALSDVGPAKIAFDCSPPGADPAAGVLLGFVGGACLRAHAHAREDDELRGAVLDGFARLFGPRAARPERWLVQDWTAETWSRGGPVAFAPPGTLTALGRALAEPVGPIHWAGTETAERWAGYMDGAVRAGERAARQACAALSGPPAAAPASP